MEVPWADLDQIPFPPGSSGKWLQEKADSCKLWDILDLPKDKPLGTINSLRSHNCSLIIVETEASLRSNN